MYVPSLHKRPSPILSPMNNMDTCLGGHYGITCAKAERHTVVHVWWRYDDRTYNYMYHGINVRYLLPKPSIWCIITCLATTGHGLSCRLHEQRSLHILQTLSGTDEVILCNTVFTLV